MFTSRHTMATTPAEITPPIVPPSDAERSRKRQILLTVIGVLLLIAWGWWWITSFNQGRLWGGNRTRLPWWRFLGLDFLHNYHAARLWLNGGNPYTDDFGDWRKEYAYPPIVLPLYAWCRFVTAQAAVAIWMTFIATVVAVGAWAARRIRVTFGLARLPLVFMIAVAVCSMPVLFAMERGQGDAVVLLMILIIAAALQRRPSWTRDLLIGFCLALAAWIKVYPIVLLLGLLALGAYRAAGLTVAQIIVIGVVPYRATQYWLASTKASQGDRIGFVSETVKWITDPDFRPAQLTLFQPISADAHSLTTYWATFWEHFHLWRIARMPGMLGAALVLVPIALWITYRVWRSPARRELAYPFLLLLAALATFGVPVSYDYNLIYLPLAALAVCDRRDPAIVGLAIVGMLAALQPFKVPWEMHVATAFELLNAKPPVAPLELLLRIENDVLFFLKLFGAIGVGVSLSLRARHSQTADLPQLSAP